MYKGLLLDFYGTLVEEDTTVISHIVRRIADASEQSPLPSEIGRIWSQRFAAACAVAYGDQFRTQREIELASLRELLDHFGADLDAEELSSELFAYWTNPQPVPTAQAFLDGIGLPICIVSNIDTQDLERAFENLGWRFDHVVTSEGCRAYKPRIEPFETALALLSCKPSEVLHVGDSLGSDLSGASSAGIDFAWINPANRSLPDGHTLSPRYIAADVSALAEVFQ